MNKRMLYNKTNKRNKTMKKFTVTSILLIIFIIGFSIYFYEGSLPAQPQSSEKETFIIAKGDSINKITNNLYDQKLIRNKLVFFLTIKKLGIENKIQAGLFRLDPSMKAGDVAKSLTRGSDDIWITVIEGLRKEEIAQLLSAELGIPESEFIKKAEEGTLFPDTYLMPRGATIDQVLGVFKANFDAKYNEELKADARKTGFTDTEILTIASMVEREANTPPTMQKVASVIVKRYKNDWPLQIDATVQYILGYQEQESSWWKEHLTEQDLKTNSLYNTYAHPGLPPAPIASPGIEAIKAVIYADPNTPYWFYISNKDGSEMHYAKTLEEHNANIAKYLR